MCAYLLRGRARDFPRLRRNFADFASSNLRSLSSLTSPSSSYPVVTHVRYTKKHPRLCLCSVDSREARLADVILRSQHLNNTKGLFYFFIVSLSRRAYFIMPSVSLTYSL